MRRKIVDIEQEPRPSQLGKQSGENEKVRRRVHLNHVISAARCGRGEHDRGQQGEAKVLEDHAPETRSADVMQADAAYVGSVDLLVPWLTRLAQADDGDLVTDVARGLGLALNPR